MAYPKGRPRKGEIRPPKPTRPERPSAKGPRPHLWITGTDQRLHSMHHPWQAAKAQAKFRGEDWQLTFEEYATMWDPYWEQRGRATEQYCMTRVDLEGPWNTQNAIIITRLEQIQKQIDHTIVKRGGYAIPGYKPRRKPIPGKA